MSVLDPYKLAKFSHEITSNIYKLRKNPKKYLKDIIAEFQSSNNDDIEKENEEKNFTETPKDEEQDLDKMSLNDLSEILLYVNKIRRNNPIEALEKLELCAQDKINYVKLYDGVKTLNQIETEILPYKRRLQKYGLYPTSYNEINISNPKSPKQVIYSLLCNKNQREILFNKDMNYFGVACDVLPSYDNHLFVVIDFIKNSNPKLYFSKKYKQFNANDNNINFDNNETEKEDKDKVNDDNNEKDNNNNNHILISESVAKEDIDKNHYFNENENDDDDDSDNLIINSGKTFNGFNNANEEIIVTKKDSNSTIKGEQNNLKKKPTITLYPNINNDQLLVDDNIYKTTFNKVIPKSQRSIISKSVLLSTNNLDSVKESIDNNNKINANKYINTETCEQEIAPIINTPSSVRINTRQNTSNINYNNNKSIKILNPFKTRNLNNNNSAFYNDHTRALTEPCVFQNKSKNNHMSNSIIQKNSYQLNNLSRYSYKGGISESMLVNTEFYQLYFSNRNKNYDPNKSSYIEEFHNYQI